MPFLTSFAFIQSQNLCTLERSKPGMYTLGQSRLKRSFMVISGKMCLSTASHFLNAMLSLSYSFLLPWPDDHVLAQDICWAVGSWQACASIPIAAGAWYLKLWRQPSLLPWRAALHYRLPATCLAVTMTSHRAVKHHSQWTRLLFCTKHGFPCWLQPLLDPHSELLTGKRQEGVLQKFCSMLSLTLFTNTLNL